MPVAETPRLARSPGPAPGFLRFGVVHFAAPGVAGKLIVMMNALLRGSFRSQFLLGFVACVGLLAYAIYLQLHEGLEPCNLCIFQRLAFAGLGLVFLLGGWVAFRYGGDVALLLASDGEPGATGLFAGHAVRHPRPRAQPPRRVLAVSHLQALRRRHAAARPPFTHKRTLER